MLPSSDQHLRAYAQVLLRHRLAILLVTVVVVAIGLLPALVEDPTYSATSSVRVRPDTTGSPFEDADEVNAQNRSRDLLTSVEVIQSAPMRNLAIDRLGPDAEPFGDVTATLLGFSEIIEIHVTAPTPGAATDAANALADVFVEERQRQAVDVLVTQSAELRRRSQEATEQIGAIDRQLVQPGTDPTTAENLRVNRAALAAQLLEFSSRADELDVEAALREGGTEVVSRADLELTPISPKPIRSGVVAGVLGLLAGVALAVVLDLVQDKISTADDLAGIDPSIPILASVPHTDGGPWAGDAEPDPAVHEAFRYLRTSLRFRGLDAPVRSVVVTSSISAEGKTTTAVGLASAFAASGTRVVLVDADLRKPAVHRAFGLSNDIGLSSILVGDASFDEVLEYAAPNLAVVTAGPPTEIANELLERQVFRRLIEQVSSQADLVIVDVPPVLPVADPLVAARAVDGVLVVARVGEVRRRDVRALLRRMRDAQIPVVGFVANDVAAADTQYGTYAAHVAD